MKQPRTRIAKNVYRYADGRYEVLLQAAGRVAPPTRFPADTPEAKVKKWAAQARLRLKKEARELDAASPPPAPSITTSTLRTEAPDYFAQIGGRPSSAADRSHVRAWFDLDIDGVRLGDLPLTAWTFACVNKAIAYWQTPPAPDAARRVRVSGFSRTSRGEGLRSRGRSRTEGGTVTAHERRAPATSGHAASALTIRHRCRVLDDFFRTRPTKIASPITDDAKIPTREKKPPVTVAPDVVRSVLERLAQIDRRTFARFYLAAVTGQRPCQIARAQPDDVELDAEIPCWLVRNAKGEPAHTIVLNPVQIKAWKVFIAVEAWGWFATSAYGKTIHAAGWPHGIRPYNARHSLARAAIKRGADLGDLQGLLGHTDPTTTRIYAPFQVDEQQRVSERLGGRVRRRVKPLGPYLGDLLMPRLIKGEQS